MLQRRRSTQVVLDLMMHWFSAVIWVAKCTAPSIGPLCLLKSANLTLHLLQQSIMLACWGFGIAVVLVIASTMLCTVSSGRGRVLEEERGV